MAWLVELLKSRGKLGGIGLIALGFVMAAIKFFTAGTEPSGYTEALASIFAGLALLGIRSKQG